ncbi:MAG: acyl-CoA dehydrogenase [Candidatus Lokiarchaeota archaeon]|nr:acyl-CoA dehydrogenase [Candidatus Lokiarchaeota archaeon]
MFEVILDDEHKAIRDEVRKFVKDEVSPDLLIGMDSNEQEYPYDFIKKATKRNLFGLRFPKEYGGRDLNWTHEILAIEEVGILGIAIGCAYSLPSICGEALNVFGTEEQKEKYLKPTMKGDLICAEGLTEPRGGSDFFGTITSAEKEGDKFIINGEKRFVAGGVGADWFIIYAKTDFDATPRKSLSAFIVERDFGIEVEEEYSLMGCRGMGAARIIMKNLEVPEQNLIGPLNGGALIFNQMMIPERLTTAAGAIGLARGCLELATRYSAKREAFGSSISRFEGINFKVAECATFLDAARGLTYHAAERADAKLPCRKEVSMAKYFATKYGFETVSESMQILGGIGYTDVYPIERLFRDARLGMIWTGSNEVQKMIIQSEVYKQILKEDKNIKRNLELDTPGAHKTEEKVYTADPDKYRS